MTMTLERFEELAGWAFADKPKRIRINREDFADLVSYAKSLKRTDGDAESFGEIASYKGINLAVDTDCPRGVVKVDWNYKCLNSL